MIQYDLRVQGCRCHNTTIMVIILLDVRMIGHYITVSMILMILRDGVTLGDDALVDRLMMLLYVMG